MLSLHLKEPSKTSVTKAIDRVSQTRRSHSALFPTRLFKLGRISQLEIGMMMTSCRAEEEEDILRSSFVSIVINLDQLAELAIATASTRVIANLSFLLRDTPMSSSPRTTTSARLVKKGDTRYTFQKDVVVPDPKEGQVLVKIQAAGFCHTVSWSTINV